MDGWPTIWWQPGYEDYEGYDEELEMDDADDDFDDLPFD